MTSQQFYIESAATRKRKRRERAATPTPRKGLTPAEWRAMPEPDATTEPAKHATWSYFQTTRYEESAMSFEPNEDAVAMHGSRGKAMPPSVVRILNRYSKQVAKIGRLDVPPATRSQLRDLARRDAGEALGPLRADWTRTKESVAALTQAAMRPKDLDAAGEARISRAWARVERILDKAPADADKYAIIEDQLQRAKASGDVVSLRALWEGVPGFIESEARDDRGRQEAARLRDVLVHVAAPPEAARAHAEAKEFARGAGRVDLSFSQAEHALSSEAGLFMSSGDSQFPGWSEQELYSLERESPDERDADAEAGLRAMLR